MSAFQFILFLIITGIGFAVGFWQGRRAGTGKGYGV